MSLRSVFILSFLFFLLNSICPVPFPGASLWAVSAAQAQSTPAEIQTKTSKKQTRHAGVRTRVVTRKKNVPSEFLMISVPTYNDSAIVEIAETFGPYRGGERAVGAGMIVSSLSQTIGRGLGREER